MKTNTVLGLYTVMAMVALAFVSPASAEILFYEDFENTLSTNDWQSNNQFPTITSEITARDGNSCAKFDLVYIDTSTYRQEIKMESPVIDGSHHFKYNETYWFGFSEYAPTGYTDTCSSIMFQTHATRDVWPRCNDWDPESPIYETWRNPVFAFYEGTNWHGAVVRGDSRKCFATTDYEFVDVPNFGTYSRGEWNDWVLKWQPSYTHEGIFKAWKNGEVVCDYTGVQTAFNDLTPDNQSGLTVRLGIYAYGWKSPNPAPSDGHVVRYYDEFRLGDGTSSYAEVCPGSSQSEQGTPDQGELAQRNYYKEIIINSSMVSGDQTNFTVLISTTDSDLATHSQADGDDIIFFDSDNTTHLDHETEYWNKATGEYIGWVRIPTLSGTENPTIYMYYGSSDAVNRENSAGTWDADYNAVFHMSETPPSTISDSTANNNDGTASGMNSVDQVSGQIDGALDFDQTDDSITVSASASLDTGNTLTLTAYAERHDALIPAGAFQSLIVYREYAASSYFSLYYNGDERLEMYVYDGTWHGFTGTTQIQDTDPHRIDLVWNATHVTTYIDGVHDKTGAFAYTPTNGNEVLWIGGDPTAADRSFDGVIDEVRISDAPRSAGWISTGFSNTKHPELFISVGAQQNVSTEPETGESVPPAPENMQNTTGNFWANHTWYAGYGNITDSYNFSVNGVWYNTSPPYYNNTGLSEGSWSNITVFAYNNTGRISADSISQNTQTTSPRGSNASVLLTAVIVGATGNSIATTETMVNGGFGAVTMVGGAGSTSDWAADDIPTGVDVWTENASLLLLVVLVSLLGLAIMIIRDLQ